MKNEKKEIIKKFLIETLAYFLFMFGLILLIKGLHSNSWNGPIGMAFLVVWYFITFLWNNKE